MTVVPGFGKPQRALCDYVSLRRNIDLHTAEIGFAGVPIGGWLPQFYEVCKLLCQSCGKSLEDFLGPAVAPAAEQMITALAEGQKKATLDRIAAHKKAFGDIPAGERQKLTLEAEARTRLLRLGQTQRLCPACESPGVLRGTLIQELAPIYDDGLLMVDQQYLADDFRCPACGLHLRTVAEIAQAGLDPQFTQRTETDLHEHFQPEAEDDYMNM